MATQIKAHKDLATECWVMALGTPFLLHHGTHRGLGFVLEPYRERMLELMRPDLEEPSASDVERVLQTLVQDVEDPYILCACRSLCASLTVLVLAQSVA